MKKKSEVKRMNSKLTQLKSNIVREFGTPTGKVANFREYNLRIFPVSK